MRVILFAFILFATITDLHSQDKGNQVKSDSISTDSLKYPFSHSKVGGLYLENPKNSEKKIEYDVDNSNYIFTNKIGDYNISHPYLMSRKEYSDYILNKSMQEYFRDKSDALDPKKNKNNRNSDNLLPQFTVNSKFFETVFGGNTIEIIPQGFATIDLGMLYQKIDNPQIPEENRSSLNFDFDQRIQLSVIGKIGKKLRLQTNYDTQATFNFQNQMKLEFTGNDDDIVKKIEMGNVSLPINSSLIQGAQSLFGVKTKLQFGKTTVTGVFSEQKSQTKTVTSEGGATVNEFEFYIDNYEANKHYFFSQYFFNNYDDAVKDFPFINSGINITRIEVWTTNRKTETENVRNIVGMMDLGESNPYNSNISPNGGSSYPDNESNSINPSNLPSGVRDISQVAGSMASIGLNEAADYVVLENARKLTSNEFTFDARLGYISLNQSLNADEVLGIAFQYTFNGKTYQVGEFSNDGIEAPENIVVKLLKSTITNVRLPIWDLMMKNIYAMGAYQVSSEDFRMDILYANDNTGVPLNYLSDSPIKDEILLKIFNLDRLNKNGDPQPDGYFDFLNGITVDSRNGKIIFPSTQPFGKYLENKLAGDNAAIKKYVFQELYDSTKFVAQQQTHLNKFMLKGKYKGEGGGGIPLGAINVPRGSVKVTSGGRTLAEGVDYTVDYQLGRVKIINENLIASAAPVSVSLENNSAFSLQTRRFMGLNIEHKFSDNFVMEANVLNLREKPLTQKVSYGVEPVNNTIFGLSATYSDEAPYLSDIAGAVSFADPKVKSTISVRGEFAYLMPGSPSGISVTGGATSYIDDFESTQIFMDIKNVAQWKLSATPKLFSESTAENSLDYGKNRAKLSWYIIDPLFYGNSSLTPGHIKNDANQLSENSVRRVYIDEVFPETEVPIGNPTIIPMFDMSYFPSERGMYNFDSDNVENDGSLSNPEDRWGGITRALTTSNFEESNIEFIHIWMMDPFDDETNNQGGELYFNLGSISEDVLRDGRKSFENGIPVDGSGNDLIETTWGLVPKNQSLLYSFDNNDNSVLAQDVGYNGLSSDDEAQFYANYISDIQSRVSAEAFSKIINDPASDDYHNFRGSDYDNAQQSILNRYKNNNGVEGNSVPASKSPESYPTASTTLPDVEDLNRDQSLSRTEAYFQYKVNLKPGEMEVGDNYIVDKKITNVLLANGQRKDVTWYQFKIPLSQPDDVVGGISDFRSIRFVRMFMTQFEKPTVLRFARLEFIRGEWRRYTKELKDDIDELIDPNSPTTFEVSAVNIEENSSRTPVPYVTPPGIEREKLFNQTQVQQQNEQSLSMKVCDLEDGDSRATFKNVSMDLRRYKRMKMFVHLEDGNASQNLKKGDLNLVVRMGSDFSENFYQYSIPIDPTVWGATMDTDVWPSQNELDMPFAVWEDIKLARNRAGANITELYYGPDGDNIVGVKGNPNMANIRTIVVGIQNISGVTQCAEVWINELRLTDFDERGGWAAAASVNANFADLADVSFSGSMSTIGFGSLEKSVSQRSDEDVKQYDLATNINLGKFAPNSWGLNIPMYYTRSETFKDPEYDPLNPDITLEKSIESMVTDAEKDERIRIAQDHTKRTSVSFTNVRKERKGKDKPKIYDIENISVSYSQSKTTHSDVNTEYFKDNTYKGGIQYNFSSKPENVRPFKNWHFAKSTDWLDMVENFNFYYFPSKLSFQTDITRRYNTEKYRNIESPQLKIEPLYNKNFMMNYAYSFTFDLTKNLKLDLSTRANNIVDEPFGAIDTEEKRDTIWTNIMAFGRPTHFHQRFNIGYKFPLQNIPAVKWVDVNFKYSADFDWQAGSLATRNEEMDLGNNLQNSNTVQLNGKLNFKKLYKMLGIKSGSSSKSKSRKPQKPGAKESKASSSSFWDMPVGIVTMLKDVTLSYSENNGIFMPGYLPEVGFFGQQNYNGGMAPSLGFMFGDQTDIRQTAVLNGWLTTDTRLNNAYRKTHVEKLSFKSSLEPLPELRIELTASRNYAVNHSEFYRYVTDDVPQEGFYSQNPYQSGNFNISYFSLLTSFSKGDENSSDTFTSLKGNRKTISNRLAKDFYGDNPIPVDPETGYPKGFGPNSQQVLIPSFLSAYSGKDASSVSLSATRDIPIPNWSITYSGLMRIPWFKDNFKNFTIAHGYRSAYSINSFITNLQYDSDTPTFDKSGNFIGEYIYSNINLVEQFSPLIRLDMSLNSNINLKTEIKKDRTVNLSMDNNMVTEILGNEYIIGVGYRVKDLKFIIRSKGRRRTIKSDLNLKVDFSYRKNRTFIRDLSEDNTQVTGGQNMTSIKGSADYALSKRLTLKVYYDQNLTKYALSTAFPTSNARFGFSVRFNLGN